MRAAPPVSMAPPAALVGDRGRLLEWTDTTHGPRLRTLARRYLRSDDLAEDCVQEVLLSLYQTATVPDAVEGWLVKALIHRVLHALRTQRRRLRHEDTAASRRVLSTLPRPESSAVEQEVIEVVEDAIATLPPPQRDVVTLRLHHDLPYQEIAATLSVPVGTVRSRLGRARKALLPLLATHLAEGCPICEELRDAVLVA